MSRFLGRTVGAVSTLVLVVAAGCGEDDDAPPAHQAGKGGASAAGHGGGGTKGGTGGRSGAAGAGRGGSAGSAAGRAGRGGTSPGGTGGAAGEHSGGTGADAGTGGETQLGCQSVTCVEGALAGDCPATAPSVGDPCTIGASCSYCFDSNECPNEKYGVILQCCSGEWSHNCAKECFDADESGGAGGQGGAGGESGAHSSAGLGGAGNGALCAPLLTACCADDGDCPTGYECAEAGGTGVCKGKLADTSRCWMDSDCPSDYRCEDALYCGCGDSCNDESPGTCVKR